MAIRKVLVPLTGPGAGEAALASGLMTAQRWQAHLTALHVRADSRDVTHIAGEGLSSAMIEDMMTATERESDRRAGAVRAMFDQVVAQHGVTQAPAAPHAGFATTDFMVATGRAEDRVGQQARLADLTVVPHPDAAEDGSSSDALHAVLFDSGRPVLIAPPAPPASLGERICVAWSGTAESAAAAGFGIAWMKRAQEVTILHAKDYQRRGPAAAELAEYLALHGIVVRLVEFAPAEREVGAGMLAAAAAKDADLLVMGAYSSSRLRQLILGGVTRHVIENAHLPVLMCR